MPETRARGHPQGHADAVGLYGERTPLTCGASSCAGLLLTNDDGVDLFANSLDVGDAAARRAIPADEPERQAQVHQFDDRQALARVVAHLPEHLEEALLASGLPVEGRDQRLRLQVPRLPQGVFNTTSSRLTHSA